MKCSVCQSQIPEDATNCPECGDVIRTDSDDSTSSESPQCDECDEELEYITAYKQWYCYDCQKYVDLPAPTDIDEGEQLPKSNPDLKSDDSEWLDEDENEKDLDVEAKESPSPDTNLDTTADDEDSDTNDWDTNETSEDLSWDDEGDEQNKPDESVLEEDTIVSIEDDLSESEIDHDDDEFNDNFIIDEEDDTDEGEIEIEPENSEPNDETDDSSESDDGFNVPPEIGLPENEIDLHMPDESEPDVEFDISEDEVEAEVEIDTDTDYDDDDDSNTLQKKGKKNVAFTKLHQTWLKVNNLKNIKPDDPRVIELEKTLSSALKGDLDINNDDDFIKDSMEEAVELEKEFQDFIHNEVSNKFHFINSKIIVARNLGFDTDEIEDELDNVSSLIAMSEYYRARADLEEVLKKVQNLPKSQDEILIGMEPDSEQIQVLLEPFQLPNS